MTTPARTEIPTLDELEALEKAATPGPWNYFSEFPPPTIVVHTNPDPMAFPTREEILASVGTSYKDAALIAAVRNALPELIKIAMAVAKMDPLREDGECQFCAGSFRRHDNDCAWALAGALR